MAIYIPEQYQTLVRLANVSEQLFGVKEMVKEDMYNFKELALNSRLNFQQQKDEQNNNVMWSKIKELEVRESAPYTIFIKYSHDPTDNPSPSQESAAKQKKNTEQIGGPGRTPTPSSI